MLSNEEFITTDAYHTYIVEGARRALKDEIYNNFKILIRNGMYDELPGIHPNVLEFTKTLKQKCDNILDLKKGAFGWCWFTISFKPEIEHSEIVDVFNKFVNKTKFVNTYMWSIEQRSDDIENTHGYHIHILFDKEKNAPSKIERAFRTKFVGKYCEKDKHVYDTYTDKVEHKIKYILGIKDDKEKDEKIATDKAFREKFGYQDYYIGGDEKFHQLVDEITLKYIFRQDENSPEPALSAQKSI